MPEMVKTMLRLPQELDEAIQEYIAEAYPGWDRPSKNTFMVRAIQDYVNRETRKLNRRKAKEEQES